MNGAILFTFRNMPFGKKMVMNNLTYDSFENLTSRIDEFAGLFSDNNGEGRLEFTVSLENKQKETKFSEIISDKKIMEKGYSSIRPEFTEAILKLAKKIRKNIKNNEVN